MRPSIDAVRLIASRQNSVSDSDPLLSSAVAEGVRGPSDRIGSALARLRRRFENRWAAWALAIGVIAVAVTIRFAMAGSAQRFGVFYPAVAIAALIGGIRAGLVATLLAVLLVIGLRFDAALNFTPLGESDIEAMIVFVLTGTIVGLATTADISRNRRKQRRATADLARSESMFASVVNSMHEAVLVLSAQQRIVFVNPAAERILKKSRDEFTAMESPLSTRRLCRIDGSPLPFEEIPAVRVFATGEPCGDVVIGDCENEQTIWLRASAAPVFESGDPRPIAAVVTLADITERVRILRELEESQARFASIVDLASDAIVTIDSEQRILLFNRAAERMFGCTMEQAKRRGLASFVPERHLAGHSAGFAAFAAGNEPIGRPGGNRPIRARRADGTEFQVEASVSRSEDRSGPLFTVILRDVGARWAAAEADALLATIVTWAPVAIIGSDRNSRITAWNPAAEELFGFSAKEAIGGPITIIADPNDSMTMSRNQARVLAGETIAGETVRRRKDGTPIDVAFQAAPVRDGSGTITAVSIMLEDIGPRRRAERELAERAAEQRQTLDAAGLGVWWIEVDSGRIHADPRSAALFGGGEIASVEAVARLFQPQSLPVWFGAERRSAILDDEPVVAEATYRNGTSAWLSMTARRRQTDDGVAEIWGTVRDISREVLAEQAMKQIEASRRVEALGRMTGGIAHDFNNLLTVISGNLQLLALLPQEAAGRRYLAEALRATESGAALNRRLTTFARQRRLATTVVDLNAQITATIDLLRRAVGADVRIDIDLAVDLWPVSIDPSEFESGLLNLVFNARDAMPDGGRISITTRNTADLKPPPDTGAASGRWVLVSVSDTGTGMHPEVAARAFEPFFTTKEIGRGTGLGLATLHGFVRQSGGFVTLRSRVGRGTTVNIHLPPTDVPAVVAGDPPKELPCGDGQRILVVEDDPNVARLVHERLEILGYRVSSAVDAEQAIALVESGEAFDLVLTDVVMPGQMSGLDLARRLRSDCPRLPVVLTTGYADSMVRGGMSSNEDFAIILKPYSQIELATTIAEALATASSREAMEDLGEHTDQRRVTSTEKT
jgi:PAS domain S-box-containing protein